MATTKKPTEATETAEQVQADNSMAEAVKAENEAAEKLHSTDLHCRGIRQSSCKSV